MDVPAIVGKGACANCSRLTADVNALSERVKLLETFSEADQRAKAQLQRRIDELTVEKQAAAREQCNADYVNGTYSR